MPDPSPPEPGGPVGLLLSRDLIFTSKVTSTARDLGVRVMTAGTLPLASSMIEQWRPKAILVDLAAGDLASPPALLAIRQVAGPGTTILAFGSHVDVAALDAARASGCDPVLPRSQFSARLPDLIRQFLGGEPGAPPD